MSMFALILSAVSLAQDPAVVITLDQGAAFYTNPEVAVTGSVNPIDTVLTANGEPVTVNADGTFSHAVTLVTGLNTLLFRGVKAAHTDGTAKLDLILDNEPPVLKITGPLSGHKTNQATIDIHGILSDARDDNPTLTRDGNPITLAAGRFTEAALPLVAGENVFTYQFSDTAGNSDSLSFSVFHSTTPPVITPVHDSLIARGESYQVDVTFEPVEDLVQTFVYVNGARVSAGSDGSFSGTFVHTGKSRSIPVSATARDVYGNEARYDGSITVAHRHYVGGLVLEDNGSQPAAGVTVYLETPLGTTPVVTDAGGRYAGYVQGLPLTVRVDDPAYVAIRREVTSRADAHRIPDIRLTARATAASVSSVFDLGDQTTVTLAGGFSGAAAVTGFSAQGLPALLPLGFSPVVGFEVHDATGSGTVAFDAARLPLLPTGAGVLLLQQSGAGWTVTGSVVSGSASLQGSFAAGGSGIYLAAVRDPWITDAMPTAGTVLTRVDDRIVPAARMDAATTWPTEISIIEDPKTTYFLHVNRYGGLLSGARARVFAAEQHRLIDGNVTTEDYTLDIFCYNHGVALRHADEQIGGALDVRARRAVETDLTEYARIFFDAAEGDLFRADLLEEVRRVLGNLTLDFTGAFSAAAPAARLETIVVDDLPLPAQAEELTAFTLWLGSPLDATPRLSLISGAHTEVILIEKGAEGRWFFRERLTFDGTAWTNDTTRSLLREGGTYALVSLDNAMTLVSGSVTDGGSPASGALLVNAHHPYYADCDASGAYETFVYRLDQAVAIDAFEPTTRRAGTVTIASTDGLTTLLNQDIGLTHPDFRLSEHEPHAEQQYVDLLPRIVLDFSMPVTRDDAVLQAGIALTSSGGTDIPLQILADLNRTRLNLLPLRSLAPDTEYTLTVNTGLQSLYGNPFSEPQSFTFRSRAAGVQGELDLRRFYLAWENEILTIRAPKDAFPNRTWLAVTNEDTPYSWEGTLINTVDFAQDIVGVKGDAVQLEATLPDGSKARHRLEVVYLGGNDYQMGTTPFSIDVTPTATLNVNEVTNVVGATISISEYTGAAKAGLAQTPGLTEASLETMEALTIATPDGSALPTFEGGVTFKLNDPVADGDTYHLVIIADVEVLTDPTNPNAVPVLQPVPLIMDSMLVVDGQLMGKDGRIRGKSDNFDGGINFLLRWSGMYSIFHDKVRVALFRGKTGLMPFQVEFRAVRVATENGELRDRIRDVKVAEAPWHQSYRDMFQQVGTTFTFVPGAPIYKVVPGFPHAYIFQGITDKTGATRFNTFGGFEAGRSIDPLTGEPAFVSSTVTNQGNAVTSAIAEVVFDPDKYLFETIGPQPPQVTARWEVGTTVKGKFRRSDAKTGYFDARSTFEAGTDTALRITVVSSENIDQPTSLVTVSGAPQPVITYTGKEQMVLDFPAGSFVQPGMVDLTVTVRNPYGQATDIKRRFVALVGEEPPQHPGKPSVLASFPADGQKGVFLDQPIEITFSEPVTGIGSNTILVVNEDGPVKLDFFDKLGQPVEATRPVTRVFVRPQTNLLFNTTYNLKVEGLIDTDEPEKQVLIPYAAEFSTSIIETVDFQKHFYRDPVAVHRNLVLVLKQTDLQNGARLTLYDARNPYRKMKELQSQMLSGFRGNHFQMELFLPADIKEMVHSRQNPAARVALDDLPQGAVVAIARSGSLGATSELMVYRYWNSNWEHLITLPLAEPGNCRSSAKLGRYLFLGFFHGVMDAGSTITRGGVRVYDMARVLEGYRNLASEYYWRDTHERGMNQLGLIATYPVPGDSYDLEAFVRKTAGGFEPAFLNSSILQPAVFSFTEDLQPPFIGMPMGRGSGYTDIDGNVIYDKRMLFRTDYYTGGSFGGMANGV
nr:Ig-like domain-containing protein [Acidobacteriota bacterium]